MEESKEQIGTKNAKLRMLSALEKTLGIVTGALKIAEVGRTTYYEWMKHDEVFNAKVKAMDNLVLDFAESSLMKQIKEGNHSSTQFLLKNKGKVRGYGDKLDITSNDETIKIHIDLGDKS